MGQVERYGWRMDDACRGTRTYEVGGGTMTESQLFDFAAWMCIIIIVAFVIGFILGRIG
jgi:hypothetical protein